MRFLLVPEEVAAAVLAYLDRRPHGEVRELVAALEQSRPVTAEPAEPPAEA